MPIETVSWSEQQLTIIDQTLLPGTCTHIRLGTMEEVWRAIKQLEVRGAPAIGITAAFGVVVHVFNCDVKTLGDVLEAVDEATQYLATSRPTAVNLFWALERMQRSVSGSESLEGALESLELEAVLILEEDKVMCRMLGEHGSPLIHEGDGLLTHCNAGGLATGDYGTALAPMYHAHDAGVNFKVFADETRPLLQGARLTAWELQQAGIDVTVICDNMAAQVMREGKVQYVFVGSDRIAANGDVANKIGTYGLAVLAKAHGIPFYVVAPTSTIDSNIAHGDDIPIEIRDATEVTHGFGVETSPEGVQVYNPAFDVTPNELVTGIITEQGIHSAPYVETLPKTLSLE